MFHAFVSAQPPEVRADLRVAATSTGRPNLRLAPPPHRRQALTVLESRWARNIEIFPAGGRLLMYGRESAASTWDLATRERTCRLPGHVFAVRVARTRWLGGRRWVASHGNSSDGGRLRSAVVHSMRADVLGGGHGSDAPCRPSEAARRCGLGRWPARRTAPRGARIAPRGARMDARECAAATGWRPLALQEAAPRRARARSRVADRSRMSVGGAVGGRGLSPQYRYEVGTSPPLRPGRRQRVRPCHNNLTRGGKLKLVEARSLGAAGSPPQRSPAIRWANLHRGASAGLARTTPAAARHPYVARASMVSDLGSGLKFALCLTPADARTSQRMRSPSPHALHAAIERELRVRAPLVQGGGWLFAMARQRSASSLACCMLC